MPLVFRALLLGLSLLVAAPAFAKDVCVQDDADFFVFKNVKGLTKPLSVVPLVGYMVRNGAAYPFTGGASFQGTGYTDSDGDGDVDTSDGWTPIPCSDVVF